MIKLPKGGSAVTVQAGDVWITDPGFAWDVLPSGEHLTLWWPELDLVEASSEAITDAP